MFHQIEFNNFMGKISKHSFNSNPWQILLFVYPAAFSGFSILKIYIRVQWKSKYVKWFTLNYLNYCRTHRKLSWGWIPITVFSFKILIIETFEYQKNFKTTITRIYESSLNINIFMQKVWTNKIWFVKKDFHCTLEYKSCYIGYWIYSLYPRV